MADFADIVGDGHVYEATPEDAIDGVQPQWVIEPGSAVEASEVLRLAWQADLAVTPRGSGSKLGLGNPPARLDLILSTRRLNRVLEHAAGDLIARLEAGVRLADAQEVFRQAGQWLPLDPPEAGGTIGGIIAANASGSHRLRYGTMRDLSIGVTYILPDGTMAKSGGKVVKNVAGYDLGKLFTGSLGTLALLVEAIVRLHPLPAAARIVGLRQCGAFADHGAAVAAILHSSLVPSAIEATWVRSMTLKVLFEGVEPGVIAQSERAAELLRQYGIVSIGAVTEPEVIALRPADADWTRVKISAVPGVLGDVLGDVMTLLRERNTGHSVSGHAGSGITYVSMDGDVERQIEAIRALRERIVQRGGTLVIEHAPLEVKRAVDVWGDAGEALALMRRVKERFDPKRTLNPGRFIGGI